METKRNWSTDVSESQDATRWLEKKIATLQVTTTKYLKPKPKHGKYVKSKTIQYKPKIRSNLLKLATSLEDKTEDFAGNPTRDALADGLMCMIKVDNNVKIVCNSSKNISYILMILFYYQADSRRAGQQRSSNPSSPGRTQKPDIFVAGWVFF